MKKIYSIFVFTLLAQTFSFSQFACGDTFTDTGGQNGEYGTDENEVYVICPSTSGQVVMLSFSEFETEEGYDSMMIFNGNTTSDQLIGMYDGTNSPNEVYSTNSNGCLTVTFDSDVSLTYSGWVATISCIDPVTCLQPTNLTASNPTDASVQLGWTSNSSETEWTIQYGPAGFTLGTGTFVTANSNPFTVNGLDGLTNYDFYVKAICSSSDSSIYSTVASATTTSEPLVCGNTFTDMGGSADVYGNDANETYVICPSTSGQVVMLTFSAFETEQDYDSLMIFNGNSTSSPLIGSFQGDNSPGVVYSTSNDGCLTANFISDGSGTYNGWIAAITCIDPVTCIQPSNLQTDTTTETSATVSWTSNDTETQWAIEYGPTGFTLGTGTTVSANSNPFTINGLNASTSYEFYVAAACSANDSSFVSGPQVMNTQVAAFTCGNIYLDNGGLENYANDSNDTTVICPTGVADYVQLVFSSFETESGYDSLMIFNGNSTAAPLIGTYQGIDTLGTIMSTSTDGCLTLVFASDVSGIYPGWSANIECIDLQASISENEKELLSVYPNPSNGKFTIENLNTVLVSYELRDMQGRKLPSPALNLASKEKTTLDLSSFDNGIYFLVVTGGNATKTYSLVKN